MASTGEVSDAADRALLEGAPASSYGAAPAAPPAAAAAAPGAAPPRPQLTPEELLRELARNADVYKEMISNYLLKGLAPIFTEALGTFVLVFVIGCTVASPTPAPWGPVAISAVLTVMVCATWKVSGANLNPAVSFALALLGKKDFGGMTAYWIFQFLGAFGASYAYKLVCAPHLAIVAPVAPFTAGLALVAEGLFTCLLVFVVLSVCLKSGGPDGFFGLAIGFGVLGASFACGHVSGCALNPAVALALSGPQGYQWGLAWCAAELGGAGCAAGLWWLLWRPTEAPATGDTGAAAENPGALKRCAAEALGTFMLVVTVGMNIVAGSHATAYSAAAILMCLIYSLGDLSGGHFNPAVTLAVLLGGRGKISKPDSLKYALAQIVAALAAGGVYMAFHMGSAVAEKSIKLTPGHGYTLVQAGAAELIATFLLAYAVLAVATVDSECKATAGIVVAAALTAGSFAVGSVSGGELNPALTLALALANLVHPGKGGVGPVASWLTLIGCEFGGAILAAGFFRFTHRIEYMPKEETDDKDVKGLSGADVEAQS